MEKFYIYIVVFLAGFILGYIVKDLITIEKKVEVNVGKIKTKGDGNEVDPVIDLEVTEKKQRKGLFKWLKSRKLQNKNKT